MTTFILFDIDATLLLTGGAGVGAMGRAGRLLFGEHFTSDGVDFAGRIDPLLIRELLERNGVKPTPDHLAEFRKAYRATLEADMAVSTKHHALPGARELVQTVHRAAGSTLGVLTGNFQETGTIKLRSCGFDPAWFAVSVWGDDSPKVPPSRDDLPAVAFTRFAAAYGRRPNPAQVTIIGDTPHDVQCAKANGCRSLGVATGRFSTDDLARAGADRAVANLTNTQDLTDWLLRA